MVTPPAPPYVSDPALFSDERNVGAGVGSARKGHSKGLQAGWVEFLGRWQWCWFSTHTFASEVHPEAADKAFKFWVGDIVARSYLGANWKRKKARQPVWVRGLEWQKRGVLHYHALVAGLPREYSEGPVRESFAAAWLGMGNTGFARVDPCNGSDGVLAYLAKYTAKGGDVDLSPNLAERCRML